MDGLTPKAVPPIANPERTSRDSSAYPSVKFFVTDHLGNVRVAYCPSINDTTCLVEHEVLAVLDYYPYGKALRSWTADPQRWQSTGNEHDTESGWDFRGARLYDADYGRFLSTDPLSLSFAGWSPYNYVLGNPIGLTDVTGLSPDGGGDGRRASFPDNADASTTVEFHGKTFVKVAYGENSFIWKHVQGLTITASAKKDLAESIGDGMERWKLDHPKTSGAITTITEGFGYGVGRAAYELTPGAMIVKMVTGKEDVNAINFAFAAFEMVPGSGSLKAGKAGSKVVAKELLEEGVEQVAKHGNDVVEGGAKLLNQFNSAESLIKRVSHTFGKMLRHGELQGFVAGDAKSIFNAITNGGTKMASGAVKMPDGTFIKLYQSTSRGAYDLFIKTADQAYKIRIN